MSGGDRKGGGKVYIGLEFQPVWIRQSSLSMDNGLGKGGGLIISKYYHPPSPPPPRQLSLLVTDRHLNKRCHRQITAGV